MKSTYSESETKIIKLLEKIETLKHRILLKSEQLRKVQRQNRELRKSREKWKAKCKDKSQKMKPLCANKSSLSKGFKISNHVYQQDLMMLSVELRKTGKLSYLAIRRVLALLQEFNLLTEGDLPCANSVQNWVEKIGLYSMNTKIKFDEEQEVCAIVDESIQIGQEKLLSVVLSPKDHSLNEVSTGKEEEGRALCYQDVQVCYVEGRKSWTGDEIEKVLRGIEQKHNITISYIVSDEDTKLKKAVRQFNVPHMYDISHAVASCLRKVFEKEPDYISFTKLVGSFQRKGVNRSFTYLIPPKQRVKARFMNNRPIIDWAKSILRQFEKLSFDEREFFNDLKQHKDIINILSIIFQTVQKIMKLFKNKGLSRQGLKKAKHEIKKCSSYSIFKLGDFIERFVELMQSYFNHYQNMLDKYLDPHNRDNVSFNICSDVIESLFGKFKAIAPDNQLHSMANTAIELPIYTLTKQEIDAFFEEALVSTKISQLYEFKKHYFIDSQAVKRRKFFYNGT